MIRWVLLAAAFILGGLAAALAEDDPEGMAPPVQGNPATKPVVFLSGGLDLDASAWAVLDENVKVLQDQFRDHDVVVSATSGQS
jgi:hypothetical protein